MGIYKLNEHRSFLLGIWSEFDKEEDYPLTRAGTEYGYEILKGWEFLELLAMILNGIFMIAGE